MNEPTNLERAERAESALTHYSNFPGMDPDSAMVDLLTDLQHWAAAAGADFDEALDTARGHFSEEAEDDPNGCAECARSYGPHYRGRCEHEGGAA